MATQRLGVVAFLFMAASAFAGQVQIQYVSELAYDQPQVGVYLRDSVDYLPHGTGGYVMPGLLDTGRTAHVVPRYLADAVEIPLDPAGLAEVLTLCGYTEDMDITQPLFIGVGPVDSEDESDFLEIGPQRLAVRIVDPDGAELMGFPTIVGTPFLINHPVYIDYEMVEISPGIELPELITAPRSQGQPPPGPIDLTVPLTLAGETNLDPAAEMPTAWSVSFLDVVLEQGANRQRRPFILDTGSQITFISTPLAEDLGIDLENPIPDSSLEVAGAGTCSLTIYAYYVDKLAIPTDQGTALVFLQPMVYVLDVPGIDGGIGSNTLFFFDESQAIDIDLTNQTLGIQLNVPVPPGGDINGDGVCNVADLQLLVAHWATTASQPTNRNRADIDLSGEINVADLELLVGGWATAAGQSGYETRLDINLDGYVNVGDLQLLIRDWGKPAILSGYDDRADINLDGYINVGDLQVLVRDWGKG